MLRLTASELKKEVNKSNDYFTNHKYYRLVKTFVNEDTREFTIVAFSFKNGMYEVYYMGFDYEMDTCLFTCDEEEAINYAKELIFYMN